MFCETLVDPIQNPDIGFTDLFKFVNISVLKGIFTLIL